MSLPFGLDSDACQRLSAALAEKKVIQLPKSWCKADRQQLLISVLPFELLRDQTTKNDLEKLQTRGADVACYTTADMSALQKAGGFAYLHIIADKLETFGRNGGMELLKLSETEDSGRYPEAFSAVRASQNWHRKYHLVFVSYALGIDIDKFQIEESKGHVLVVKQRNVGDLQLLIQWLAA